MGSSNFRVLSALGLCLAGLCYGDVAQPSLGTSSGAQSSSKIRGSKTHELLQDPPVTIWTRLLQWPAYPGTSPSVPSDGDGFNNFPTMFDGDATGAAPIPQDSNNYAYALPGKGSTGKGKGVSPPDQDDYYYSPPGKGKGSIGKGKGSLVPPAQDDYVNAYVPPGKGKGGTVTDDFYYPYIPPGKGKGGSGKGKGSIVPPPQDDFYSPYVPPGKGVTGKGKGSVLPPVQDDFYYPYVPPGKGKGSTGKGKGTIAPEDDYYVPPGRGKGTTGKGKGGVYPPEGDDFYYPYVPPGKGSTGKGKGSTTEDDDFSYGNGKGKGGFSSSNCEVPYLGSGSIPDDSWLDQNGCLHLLPPTPPAPSFEPMPFSGQAMMPVGDQIYEPPPTVSTYETLGAEVLSPMPSYSPPSVSPVQVWIGSTSPSSDKKTGKPIATTALPTPAPSTAPTLSPSLPRSTEPSFEQSLKPSLKPSKGIIVKVPTAKVVLSTEHPSAELIVTQTETETEDPYTGSLERESLGATPFEVSYTLDSRNDPSKHSFDVVAHLTLAHIQSFAERFFNSTKCPIVSFSGSQIGNSGVHDPASIGFEVLVVFLKKTNDTPSQLDLDAVIDRALSEPAVEPLIKHLESLGTQSSFSSTVSVDYHLISVPSSNTTEAQGADTKNATQVAIQFIGSMVVAFCVLSMLSVGFVLHSRRRRRQRQEDQDDAARGLAMFSCTDSVNKDTPPSSTGGGTVCSGVLEFGSDESNELGSKGGASGMSLFDEANQVE